MPEVKTEVITYKVSYLCDSCKEGFMESICQCQKSYLDDGHMHKCSACDVKYGLDEVYPKIVYEERRNHD